ncbi:MAG: 1-deoxy-D-xylulose-5-phosphate reductoisomerase [Syntrophobacterales bacterium CG_4_8_14_3_um_filter_58_8]|nr:MAG: 1-deoxy-D-xylulose-5-phosphate reductoisomerase [Syntrophobacterales bacterium CG03_land_8_20_14_0_80_58_14]PJC75443.1 MAG: 1-deoxy-D-xylulose-5-phosphate reductoisomerase [Syntrophobacterales bacterium CG_4_8_14_3_um_filter_58_8]
MKRISILGSTGSIGVSTLDVISAHPGEFTITALAGGRNIALLKQQIERFRPRLVAVIDEVHARDLRTLLGATIPGILSGPEGYREAAAVEGTDMVVSAMVGAAGLLPTLDAIAAGRDIALANKETLVMAGGIVLNNAAQKGVTIIPVDSEHSAIFQCLQGHHREDLRRIILTASGGPFLHASAEELAEVTPAQALRHPNWVMGKKITIDSATMMNKGLEAIEASWLFDLPVSKIDVLIHPQSIIHSLVEYRDGSVIAQLGVPDMRVPIAYALSYPRRMIRNEAGLDLVNVGALTFFKPDPVRFPALRLAYAAAETGGTAPTVLNAANEVAVTAFIDEEIGFNGISQLVDEVLSRHRVRVEPRIEEILAADRRTREEARNRIKGIKH